MAERYRNVPASLLSFTVLSEPSRSYFSPDSHAKLVEDIACVLRDATPDRLIIAAALTDQTSRFWTETVTMTPNDKLDPSIVQAESFYPWHNLRRSAYTAALNNWPYDEAPVINNVVRGDGKPLTLRGDFAAGTLVTYFIGAVNQMEYKPEAVVKADGKEIGRMPLYGFTIGEDNCSNVLDNSVAEFGNNGRTNGYAYTVQLPEGAKTLELFMTNDDRPFMAVNDIEIRHPAPKESDYLVIDNRYQPTGVAYEFGPFTTTLIHCNEIWEDAPADIQVNGDGTYASLMASDAKVFDMHAARAYYDMWQQWADKSGGRFMDFEFISLLSMPEAVRTNYMDSVLSLFDAYDIPWVFSADTDMSGGIIVYAGAVGMEEFPDFVSQCVLPRDGSVTLHTEYDYDCYFDEPVMAVMRAHMED